MKDSSLLPSLVETAFQNLKLARKSQALLEPSKKNAVLKALAKVIQLNTPLIIRANQKDLAVFPAHKPASFRDRLALDEQRIQAMVDSLLKVADLEDPVGEVLESKTLANGLHLQRIRGPIGVLFMIFESRPNVILEAFSLAFKSGNTIALRGGSESAHTAQVIYQLMRECLTKELGTLEGSLPFWGSENYDRNWIPIILARKDLIDVVVPRGGDTLISLVQEHARMPIIKNDRGLCHIYVDESADLEMAIAIINNAKTQRPSVCNAAETILLHKNIAQKLLPRLYEATSHCQLEWRVDQKSHAILQGKSRIALAKPSDWDTEYLDFIVNCALVENLQESLDHIEKHGSKHSECIITANQKNAQRFQTEVDAAVVYWNASTRFTDGYEFGLGGELGISTQKLHVRGPVGLRELTTPRWIASGNGQIRP